MHTYLITIATIRIVSDFTYNLLFTTYMLILQQGETPLYEASQSGHDKVVEVLIAAGADVNLAEEVSY